jgi:hypothetical protein
MDDLVQVPLVFFGYISALLSYTFATAKAFAGLR